MKGWQYYLPRLVLALFALAIWLLDLSWYTQAPDAVVIVLLLPLAFFLSGKTRQVAAAPAARGLYWMAALLGLGVVCNSMLLMAFGWAGLAQWVYFQHSSLPRARLWLLCAGAFPWVLMDLQQIGWIFRLSGAAVTAVLYDGLGLDVSVSGTQMWIGQLPVSVEAACGGLQLLQVLLSGGVALTLLQFPRSSGFWTMIVLLPLLAWLANTARIIVICAWGLAYGLESAAGGFHTWGAMLVVFTMLALYLLASRLVRYRINQRTAAL